MNNAADRIPMAGGLRRREILAVGAAAVLSTGLAAPGWSQVSTRSPTLRQATLSHRISTRFFDWTPTGTGLPGTTISVVQELRTTPRWARILLMNDTPNHVTVDGACIALTAEMPPDGITPMNELGTADDTLWVPLTFSSHGEDSETAEPHGGARRLTMPANPSGMSEAPALAWSDWARLKPAPRGGGRDGALVLVRGFSTGHLRFSRLSGIPDPSLERPFNSFWLGGNGTIPPYGHKLTINRFPFGWPFAIEYDGAEAGATVMGIGDSIIAGNTTTGGVSCFGLRACDLVTQSQKPVDWVNDAYSGRPMEKSMVDGLNQIRMLNPQVVLLQMWSEAGGGTPDGAKTGFQDGMKLVQAAQAVGAVPIPCTAAPVFKNAPNLEHARTQSNAWVRALAPNLPVLDLDRILGSGSSPNAYRDGLSNEGTHPNNLGHTVVAEVLAPMLRDIIRT